jgi:hypothetical protein
MNSLNSLTNFQKEKIKYECSKLKEREKHKDKIICNLCNEEIRQTPYFFSVIEEKRINVCSKCVK